MPEITTQLGCCTMLDALEYKTSRETGEGYGKGSVTDEGSVELP